MKKTVSIASLALAVWSAQVLPAQAINKEWAAVAGFVGGVLVANAANHHPAPRTVYYSQPAVVCPPAPVVVHHPAPVVYHQPAPVVEHHYHYRHQPRGYYEYRTERVWVPGSWVHHPSPCGSRRQTWQPGYYSTQRNKVWVQAGVSRHW
jgi:hypothetical protein